MSETKTKQPREIEDFDIICTKRMGDDDTITNVTASFTGPDQSLVIERCTWTDTVAKIWTSAGTDMVTYKITALIRTANGRLIEADFHLVVKDV